MPFGINQGGRSALTPGQIAHLTSELPPPLTTYRLGTIRLSLYQAKEFYSPNWLHPHWPALVSEARRSYLRYGAVPLLDSYDDKAAIYMCRADYHPSVKRVGNSERRTEWLSIRFIPADGAPVSTEDLDQFQYRGKSIGQCLLEQASQDSGQFWQSVMTISRICGFADLNQNEAVAGSSAQNLKYSAVAFLLMNHYLFQHESVNRLKHVTAVFSERLFNKIVVEVERDTGVRLSVPGIEEYFKCAPGEVKLERKVMAYHFPGYFLNIHDLAKLLKRLYIDGHLTAVSFQHYLENFLEHEVRNWEEFAYRNLLYRLHGLGRLLTSHGPIPGATITGEQLRALVEVEVRDGPRLQFIDAPSWRAQLAAAVNALGLLSDEKNQ